MFWLAFSRSERAFSEVEFAFLKQVALQVAIAVENALDFEEATEDRASETKRRLFLEEEFVPSSEQSSATVQR